MWFSTENKRLAASIGEKTVTKKTDTDLYSSFKGLWFGGQVSTVQALISRKVGNPLSRIIWQLQEQAEGVLDKQKKFVL